MTEPRATLGERVTHYRKRRGLSQIELGRLISRSDGWVSQIERGARPLDRRSVLESLAKALGVTVADLSPESPDERPAPAPEIAALRRTLIGRPALELLVNPNPTAPIPPADDLEQRRKEIWDLVHGSQVLDAAPLIQSLIADLEAQLRIDDSLELQRIAASTYLSASSVLTRTGETDAAWVASDRAIMAADAAGDIGLVAACHFRLALTFLGAGQLDDAERAASNATDALAPTLDTADDDVAAVYGALNLNLAVVAARAGRRRDAWQHIGTAETVAARVGPGRNDYDTEFGPANVALHAVAVAVELGDAGEALDRAEAVDASSLSVERRARFLLDVARAHTQRRNPDAATAALLEAETLAPEQVRRHGLARDITRDLLAIEGKRTPSELRELAGRLGLVTD